MQHGRTDGGTGALRALARGASMEVLARKVPPPDVLADLLPRGSAVYVPFPPRGRWADTVAACERARAAGMRPVPHLSARSVRSRDELGDWLAALAEAGVDAVMLVAGDGAAPAGPYADTLALLDSGLLAEHGVRSLGVTAYPEGHPLAGPTDLAAALRRKTEYARATDSEMWLVTQFVFSPDPALAWLARTREAGCTLPVRIGVPGPVALRTLVGYAVRCGVAASARAVMRKPGVARLAGRWSPTPIVRALALHLAAAANVSGGGAASGGEVAPAVDLHVFTFGGLADAAGWLSRLRAAEPEGAGPEGAAAD